ncbi:hypothetical protein [Micromonospora lupini]|uniref:Uncharacterized protein n=1 Tax=Micromonospora lupini str. Lupac 08 TaxID=1150864 RepID=I0L1X8_9ACTN|nr:hypothetical protein [Micromonospora lupini]CCH17825.1 exported hypothetical protein [Micromonospora lupini str. Lupac 08]
MSLLETMMPQVAALIGVVVGTVGTILATTVAEGLGGGAVKWCDGTSGGWTPTPISRVP